MAFKTVTAQDRVRMRRLAPAACERLRAYGLADRRESAWALLLSGAAPLAGHWFLGWSSATTVLALSINLLLGMVDDIAKLILCQTPTQQMQEEWRADRDVWPTARALAGGGHSSVRSVAEEEDSNSLSYLAGMVFLAFCVIGLPAAFLYLAPDLDLEAGQVTVGVLPTLLFFLIVGLAHAAFQHSNWRRAGSVRLGTATNTSYLLLMVGMGTFFVFFAVPPGELPRMPSSLFAVSVCAFVIFVGLLRLYACRTIANAAHWLEREARAEATALKAQAKMPTTPE